MEDSQIVPSTDNKPVAQLVVVLKREQIKALCHNRTPRLAKPVGAYSRKAPGNSAIIRHSPNSMSAPGHEP
ncbi:hypothetical protein N9235_00515 [Gammaproteobacteria bacterium]|jgi:hypothetical protein|nr:hypothetical protein [Gammaproteobacteria bacterium]